MAETFGFHLMTLYVAEPGLDPSKRTGKEWFPKLQEIALTQMRNFTPPGFHGGDLMTLYVEPGLDPSKQGGEKRFSKLPTRPLTSTCNFS